MKSLESTARLWSNLLVIIFVALPCFVFGQTTYFNITSYSSIPSGWSVENNVSQAVNKGSYLLVESRNPKEYLITKVLNMNGVTDPELTVDIRSYGSGTHRALMVEVSTDGGSSWLATSFTTSNTTSSYSTKTLMLSGITFSSTTKLRFSSSSTNGRGIRMRNIKLVGAVAVVNPEPTNHLTGLNLAQGTPATSVIDLTWTDATGTDLPSGYLIKANTTGIFTDPVDGTEPLDDTDLSDGEAVVKVNQGIGSYSFSGLSASTQYYVKVWPYSNSSSSIDFKLSGTIPTSNVTTDAIPIDPEPTNHVTGFTVALGSSSSSVIDLSWTDATGTNLPAGYIIKANTTGVFTDPVDGTDPSADTDLSDGEALVKVALGAQAYSFTGLNPSTQYFVKIWPYSNSSSLIDFKLSGTVPTGDITTASGPSVIAFQGFEQSGSEWATSFSTPPCSNSNNSDVWNYVTSLTNFSVPEGNQFWGIRDLKGNCGGSSETLTLDEISTAGYTDLTLSFQHISKGLDSDYIRYRLKIDGVFGSYTYLTKNPSSWQTEIVNIGTASTVSVEFYVKIDGGNDYGALDDIKLTGISAGTPEVTSFTATAGNTQVDLSWSSPSTSDEVLIIASSNTITTIPLGDGSAYTASATFGSGTQTVTGEYVVFKGTGTSATITSLTNATAYNFTIFNRVGTDWSAGVSASATPTIVLSAGDLVITEIMYNESGTDDEWIEIYNTTSENISLDNVTLYDGSNNSLSGTVAANSYFTIGIGADGDGTFNDLNPFTPDLALVSPSSNTSNKLSNSGETIRLIYDQSGSNITIDEVTYDDGGSWPSGPDGNGPSLELIHYSLDNSVATNWKESGADGGSPKIENSKVLTSAVAAPSLGNASHWVYAGNINGIPQSTDDIIIASGHNLTLSSNFTAKDMILHGTLTVNGGIATFNDVTLSTGATISNSSEISWNDIDNESGGAVTIGGTLRLNQGGYATINKGTLISTGVVVVDNNTTLSIVSSTGGALTIEDDASLVIKSGSDINSFNGTVTVRRIGGNSSTEFDNWGAPVADQSLVDIFSSTNPCDIYAYDESTQQWSYDYADGFSTTCNGHAVTFTSATTISGGDGIMNPGRGYFVPGETSNTQEFVGVPNHGTISFSALTGTDSSWNSIANPYPCAVDLHEFYSANSQINATGYFWIQNGNSGDYAAYAQNTGATTVNGYTPTQYLASGQGMFVEVLSDVTLNFTDAMKVEGNNSRFMKSASSSDMKKLWLSLGTQNYSAQTLIAFDENATSGYDLGYDAKEFDGNADFGINSVGEHKKYQIQTLESLEETAVVELSLRAAKSQVYTIKIDDIVELDNYAIQLEDKETGKWYNLKSELVTLYLGNSTGDYTDRFYVHFKKQPKDSGGITSIEDLSADQLLVYSNGVQTVLDATMIGEKIETVEVYNLQGREVFNKQFNTQVVRVNIPNNQINLARIRLSNGETVIQKIR